MGSSEESTENLVFMKNVFTGVCGHLIPGANGL